MSSDFHTPSRHPGLAQARAAQRKPQVQPRAGWPLWAKVLAVLLVAALSLGLYRFVEKRKLQDQQMREAVLALEGSVQQMKEASAKGDFSQVKIDAGSGPAKTPAEVMQRVMLRAVEQRQAYERELAPLALDKVLVPGSLATAEGMRDAKDRLIKARSVVLRYQGTSAEVITKAGEDIDQSLLESGQKAQLKQGFLKGQEKGLARASEKWAQEMAMVNELYSTLMFLEARRSAWQPDGGQFAFTSQAELATFNQHLQEIKRIGQQSENLERQGFESAEQQFKQLRQ